MIITTSGEYTWEGELFSDDGLGNVVLKNAKCISERKPTRDDLQGTLPKLEISLPNDINNLRGK